MLITIMINISNNNNRNTVIPQKNPKTLNVNDDNTGKLWVILI